MIFSFSKLRILLLSVFIIKITAIEASTFNCFDEGRHKIELSEVTKDVSDKYTYQDKFTEKIGGDVISAHLVYSKPAPSGPSAGYTRTFCLGDLIIN